MTSIAQQLGDVAESLLNFRSPKLPVERLHGPALDAVDRLFAVPDAFFAHILAIDIVGFSNRSLREQLELHRQLRELLGATPTILRSRRETFVMSTTSSVLARTRYDFFPLHEGDGAFLVFRENPFGPLWSALVITQALENTPNMQVRMGLHSDWLCIVPAGRGKFDAVGDAINIAKGVMDYADARHILLSKVVVDMLRRFNEMQECLHELGEYPLKHGHRIQIFNLHDIAFGNPAIPSRLQLKAA